MSQNSDGYMPFSQAVGGHPHQPPRPTMTPAPQGYGEAPRDGQRRPEDGASGRLADRAALAPTQTAPVPDDVVVLSRAYMAFGEPVTRLKLRRPVTKDIRVCGNPLKPVLGPDGTIVDLEIKWDVIARYIPLLAEPKMTDGDVDKFEYIDLDACAAVISRFFVRLA